MSLTSPGAGGTPPAPQSSKLDSSKLLHGVDEVAPLRSYNVHPDYQLETATPGELSFRHSGWATQRRRVWESFQRVGVGGASLQAFAECGSGCWVQHSASKGQYRLSCNNCKSRWCVPCGVARAARLRRSVQQQLQDHERVRFITLTLRHSNTPLSDQLDRIQRDFRELRRRDVWTRAIEGAAAFLEVKVSSKTGLWHVHLHILAVGTWIDSKELSREWHKVTGDSSVVDVRLAKSKGGVAAYVTKYVTKPLDSSVLAAPDRLDEAIVAMRGRRLCNGSGSLRTITADDEPDDALDDWHTIGRLDQLLHDSRLGDKAAAAILALLRSRSSDVTRSPGRAPPPPE